MFPRERDTYSVFIDEREVIEGKEKMMIEEVLLGFGEKEVERMREVKMTNSYFLFRPYKYKIILIDVIRK